MIAFWTSRTFKHAGVTPYLAVLIFAAFVDLGVAQDSFDNEPINYSKCTPNDPVQQLAVRLSKGDAKLEWDTKHGWLPSLLKHLDVPISSQTLVFSKTSQQIRFISPTRPRALYFNDDVYVGWVSRGEFVELAAVDPTQGAMFYKVSQDKSGPSFIRDRGECLACHASRRTQDVPGFLVRSVFPTGNGQPAFRLGTTTTDHTTPFRERFGGWYVTGTHGEIRHRGNAILAKDADRLNLEEHANRKDLPSQVARSLYLRDTSDIAALMVLEHQAQMHNWITRASYKTRQALHQQRSMNEILDRPAEYRSESTTRRINRAAEDLLEYLFVSGEAELESPIVASEQFVAEFEARGPHDKQGRSLRDLDLTHRMFRYPCSFLIYSDSFQQLPKLMLERLELRIREILSGDATTVEFSNLTREDRTAIREILNETHWMFQNQRIPGNHE